MRNFLFIITIYFAFGGSLLGILYILSLLFALLSDIWIFIVLPPVMMIVIIVLGKIIYQDIPSEEWNLFQKSINQLLTVCLFVGFFGFLGSILISIFISPIQENIVYSFLVILTLGLIPVYQLYNEAKTR